MLINPFHSKNYTSYLNNVNVLSFLNVEIPKDDRLMLRKMIKDGNEEVIKLLSDSSKYPIIKIIKKYKSN